jgi:serine/threonine protein kinase
MLKALAKKEHSHIIKLLATYRMGGRYHLMFPWADKSLRTYWHDHPHPKWNQETLMWDLGQMKGIASGLQAIHNFRQQDCRTRQAHPDHTLLVPGQVEPDEYWYGRHGDIKPENILWFRSTELEDADKAGVLQIADFGLGRFHGRESRSQMPARTIVSTPTYEPPELALDLKVSRAYDIWSLGCVFLEYITWRLGGFDMLEAFDYARLVEENDGYCSNKFYTLRRDIDHETHAFVQDAVAQWIMHLHSHERCSGLIHDLLDLVKNQLLVVSAKRRITSEMLVAELQKLAERAEADYGYLVRPAPYGDTVSKTAKVIGSKVGYSPPLLVDTTEFKKPISQAMRSTLGCPWPPRKQFDCDSSFDGFYKSRNAIESLLFSSSLILSEHRLGRESLRMWAQSAGETKDYCPRSAPPGKIHLPQTHLSASG